MIILLAVMYVCAKFLGVFAFDYNKITKRLEISVSGSAYFIIVNLFTLISIPFAIWYIYDYYPMQTSIVFDAVSRAQCLLLYIISITSFLERLRMLYQSLDAMNEHSDLVRLLENTYSLIPKRTLLFIIISLKCILPVNQLITPYFFIAKSTNLTVWRILANCVLFFTYGQLFIILNTWSLRNLSFRLLYDTLNNRLSAIFDNLKYQKATSVQRFSFASGMILCNNCKFSAAIDEIADFNSAIYLSLLRISSLTPYVYLGVITFQFINNVFGLYRCFNLLDAGPANGDFKFFIIAGIATAWNFVDIFVLFLVCSLVNEGSACGAWKTLGRQFDTTYSSAHLDRSVSLSQIRFRIFFSTT